MSKPMEFYFSFMQFVLFLVQGYYLQYFYGSFLECRVKGRCGGLIAAVSYTLLRTLLYVIWPAEYESRAVIGKQAVSLCILAVLALFLYQARHAVTCFLAVAFQAVIGVSVYLAVILMDWPSGLLLSLWNWCLKTGTFTKLETFRLLSEISVAGMHFLQIMIAVLLIRGSLRRIVRDYREKDIDMPRTQLLFILIPALSALLLCTLLRVTFVIVEENSQEFLYHRYPVLMAVLPAILLLSLASILYGVKSIQDILKLNREKNSRIVLEKQVEGLKEHIGEIERLHSGIQSMKHDMRNTLAVVQQLASVSEGQGTKELKRYLSEIDQTMDQMEPAFRTGNAVVDALLNMKYHEIVRSIPEIELNAEGLLFPEALHIRSYDIGMILGNALDNAMEACVKLKKRDASAKTYIRLAALVRGQLLLLKIENSFGGSVRRKPQAEFPESDKEGKGMHGIGMMNIKSAAEKYQGTVDWKVKDRTFILAVMLRNDMIMKGEEQDEGSIEHD